MENKYYTSEKNHQIVIALLKEHNIRKIVASPGATNVSFIGSLQSDPYFEIYSSADERSAAYIACGLAAETGEPVVLTCTGATSSRNYMPGLTEAYYRKLPVLAITSSQPDCRAGHNYAQYTIRNQPPEDVVTLSVTLPKIQSTDDEWDCVIKANQAILSLKHHGGGPAHINLVTGYSRDFSVRELPKVRKISRIMPNETFPEMPKGRIGVFVGSHNNWSTELTQMVDAFCESHNAVVFCDHTSGYKGKYRLLYSLVAYQDSFKSKLMNLDLLIYIGDISGDYPTIGMLRGKETWRVSEDGRLCDRFRTLSHVFEMPEETFFKAYTSESKEDDSFLNECKSEDLVVREKFSEVLPNIPFSNIWVASELAGNLPENSEIHMGILNSLRSWNLFEIPKTVTSFCNVGGFGIDGILSSLVGASLANPSKLYFGVLGDLAFFYDMNVLGNRHVSPNIRILLVNNGKGTEFRNYDHSANIFGDDTDKYIAAAGHYGNQSKDLIKHYATDLGYEYLSAGTKEEFKVLSEKFLNPNVGDKPIILEVFTNSTDESMALKMSRNCVSDASTLLWTKGVGVAKNVLGEKGIRSVSGIINRLK